MLQKPQNVVSGASQAILVGAQKIKMLIEMKTVKTVLLRLQMVIRTLLRIVLEAILVPFWQRTLSTFCLCSEPLYESEFKNDGLINLVGEISR